MSISLSKWPMLPTMAWCFIRAMCSARDDAVVAGGGDEDVGGVDDVLEPGDLVALHRRLQRADRIDLGDDHAGALAPQRRGAALAHVAVAADHGDLAADHHVGGAVDAVDERVAAAVEVVELRLGDRVVDVDGREQQRAGLEHLVEPVHAGGGLLGDALDALADAGPERGLLGHGAGQQRRARPSTPRSRPRSARAPRRCARTRCPCARAAWRRRRRRGSCSGPRRRASAAPARCTTSTPRASRPSRRRPGTPLGFSVGAGRADDDGGGGVVLGREDVAASTSGPAAPSSISVSMSTAVWMVMCSEPVMRAPLEGLAVAVLGPQGHEAGHLVLGQVDLLAAERRPGRGRRP